MKTLPNPEGPFLVGSVSRELVDPDRPAHVLSQQPGRRIFVKSWYPADPAAAGACRRERLWEHVRGDPHIPGVVKLMLRRAMKVTTSTYADAPYAAQAGPPRIVIYSHGLISFASENSTLMEHLASRGYVVISLQHREQLAELRALQQAQPKSERTEQAELQRQIAAASKEERAALWKEYFRLASNTNRIVAARSADAEHVLAGLDGLLATIPGLGATSRASRIAAIGLSIGGAVATELAKRSRDRTNGVVNIDGGMYGTLPDEPVEAPYLMLYSEENAGSNELSLAAAGGARITAATIPGTKHLNFHDIAAVHPWLKWLGALGSADPVAVVKERNRSIADFLSKIAQADGNAAGV
ncbi:MAG TPA: acetylhydrolase [Gammaproteobacteria bacterium]